MRPPDVPIPDPRPTPAAQGRDPVDWTLLEVWHRHDATYFGGRLARLVPDELVFDDTLHGGEGEYGVRSDGTTRLTIDRRIVLRTHPHLPDWITDTGLRRVVEDVVLHEMCHVVEHRAGHAWTGDANSHGHTFATLAAHCSRKMGLRPPRPDELLGWPGATRDPAYYLDPQETAMTSPATTDTAPTTDTSTAQGAEADHADKLARALVTMARRGYDSGHEEFDRTDTENYAAKMVTKAGPEMVAKVAARLAVAVAVAQEGFRQVAGNDTDADAMIDEMFTTASGN